MIIPPRLRKRKGFYAGALLDPWQGFHPCTPAGIKSPHPELI